MNGAFGDAAAMHVGREQLVGGLPLFRDNVPEISAAFVIHDVVVNPEAASPEALHYGVQRRDVMLVAAGGERVLKDCVGVAVLCSHDILIATTRLDEKMSTIV